MSRSYKSRSSNSSSSRSVTSSDIVSTSSIGARDSMSRRAGTYETRFAGDAPKNPTLSRSSWLGKWLDWVSPDSETPGEYGKSWLKSVGTFAALVKGVPMLAAGVKKLLSKDSVSSSSDSADALAVQALNNAGANISDGSNSRSQNGLWSTIKSLFSGDGSFSLNLDGLTSALTGIGSQYASSLLNYENQVKLIDKQNEYNTPANQMQRFKDAGLNPNLIYGLGSNGNQPASGSVAPVDFDTSQRENRLARMQIQTQTALAKADIASKMADVQLKEKQCNNVDASTNAQLLANNTYMQTWFMDMNVKSQQLRESANRISNDNRRIEFENAVADAQKALFEYQSQPGYMQKIGSAESFITAFDAFMTKLGEKIMSNAPWQKSDFYWGDGLLKVTGLREVDEQIGRWRSN